MATGKALDGKPYAGNPHVRFDEGEVAPAATPRRGSLLYNKVQYLEKIAQDAGRSGMTVDQFADNMRSYIKRYSSQLQGNRQAISQLRQITRGVQSGKLNPSQIHGEWQKAMRLMPNGGQVNAYTNGTRTQRGQAGYRDAFDAGGRRIKGTTINVNNAPAAPQTDAQGRITNPNSGWRQVGRGIYVQDSQGPTGQPQGGNAVQRGSAPLSPRTNFNDGQPWNSQKEVKRNQMWEQAAREYRSRWNDLAGSGRAPQGRQAPGSQGWWAQTADLLTPVQMDFMKRKYQMEAANDPNNPLRKIKPRRYF